MKNQPARSFAIFGLGRFGTSIVSHLAEEDVELLAADRDLTRVEAVSAWVDQAVVGDASDEAFLTRLAIEHFDVVVFAMGEDFESSVMGTMVAKERGCPRVVVKALDPRQAKILIRVGADQVVLPEVEMGAKIARSLVNANIIDAFAQIDGIDITERRPDPQWIGKTLAEADVRRSAGVEVLALIRTGQTQVPVKAETVLRAEDVLVTVASE
ncbi:MAG: TrkA family potassium uptake protein [Lactobacillus sp.]|jgi:trk system potassium uptake protein TrkA|uniref:Potassium channel family protein n=1 Tax=Lacticaseibacillus suilingensis TaxID=2799577 RepID=A0ABW4BFP2_9LACO|nr:TrkA family potassium uptake protein [Lacticaseibacillus suilingensis]MCI1894223.1 TrkA family potassium uptake protein [Lactobacillus sp.]MCI1917113.1 TrkA family potassium uptake protein [Lactobacillus sp.]MCI1941553.1 TrkA family potassium uptake protein [Lactobacillus sp.]MCI1972099.1 TrkA family potassium uptake protein [Lactobacillus sp.]MCI2016952.1 TrkA family potassium uptake protein [Lactobacillus sp.]